MADQAELRQLLERVPGGTVGCDVCGFSDVEVAPSLFRLVPADGDEGGLDVVTTVCRQCSAVQLYSRSQLEKLG